MTRVTTGEKETVWARAGAVFEKSVAGSSVSEYFSAAFVVV